MRKINEEDFISYTISRGWNCTVYDLKTALREFSNIPSGTLYGNKADGTKAIIDQK